MKKLQVFIIVLLSSSITANACGFFPFGEELRFCFFRPDIYGFNTFGAFDYTSDYFHEKNPYQPDEATANDQFWVTYCKNKVDLTEIKQAIYKLRREDICKESKNEMIKYLFAIKDNEAIAYLKFAKDCEYANGFYSDPWEREQTAKSQRTSFVNKAIDVSKKIKNNGIRLRYIFLAIRMAYYNGDMEKVRQLYDTFFADTPKDMIYYWSLYFRAIAETNKSLGYFYAAQVFANSPDKRFPVYLNFYSDVNLKEVLSYAKTDKERANVYLLKSILRPDRCLDEIEGMYKNDRCSEGLAFLLLREVNKIEDWVYTPYYSFFEPTVVTKYQTGDDDSDAAIFKRAENDRIYAQKVLDFIKKSDRKKIYRPEFWDMAQAQLEVISKQYSSAISTINRIGKSIDKNSREYTELQKIKALALTANQEYGNAIIPEAIKSIIIKNRGDQKFIFAIGRELEYLGNTDDAVLLFAHLNTEPTYGEGEEDSNTVYWISEKQRKTYENFYYEYFDYINVNYTPEQIESLINALATNKRTDDFSKWKYSSLKNRMNELYDLLGTKYIRQNKLERAEESFAKVSRFFLTGADAAWERTDKYYNYFDENPFYQIKHTPDFIPVKDNGMLTKLTVTRQLIQFLRKADDPNEKDRDYYYFLVANCYLNMTQYGNSWMMRRYFWTTDYSYTVPEDETEYRQALLAKKYYNLAYKYAKTPKFKALALRMLGHCESNSSERYYYFGESVSLLDYPSYLKLKKQYPKYYDELSNCTAFADYFKARR